TPSPDKSPSLSTRADKLQDSPSLAEGDKGGGYQNTPAQKDTLTQNQNPNEPTTPKDEPSLFDNEQKSPELESQQRYINGDYILTTKTGQNYIIPQQIAQKWLETFNLKNINESYKPNLNKTIKEAIGNKDIILTNGSLLKLIKKNRTKYIPQIKETLNTPDFIIRDNENIIIFAKRIDDKEFFTSINLEKEDYFVSISNAPKKSKTLENKLKAGAEVIYQSPNAKSNTETLLQDNKSLSNRTDEQIIQHTAEKIQ
ncbi:PBECR2 nuclease fold domain-containing protein, partial [Helicobacter sp. T3_23-1059]